MNSRPPYVALPADAAVTERLGERIGAKLRRGQTLGLCGPLGAGKTTFMRGVARGLRVDDPEAVSSPTYLLVVEHPGPLPLLHADAYFPAKLEGFLADGGIEYLLDDAKVVCVEWAENVRNMLPENTLWVHIDHLASGGRSVELRSEAPGDFPWIEDLEAMAQSE